MRLITKENIETVDIYKFYILVCDRTGSTYLATKDSRGFYQFVNIIDTKSQAKLYTYKYLEELIRIYYGIHDNFRIYEFEDVVEYLQWLLKYQKEIVF